MSLSSSAALKCINCLLSEVPDSFSIDHTPIVSDWQQPSALYFHYPSLVKLTPPRATKAILLASRSTHKEWALLKRRTESQKKWTKEDVRLTLELGALELISLVVVPISMPTAAHTVQGYCRQTAYDRTGLSPSVLSTASCDSTTRLPPISQAREWYGDSLPSCRPLLAFGSQRGYRQTGSHLSDPHYRLNQLFWLSNLANTRVRFQPVVGSASALPAHRYGPLPAYHQGGHIHSSPASTQLGGHIFRGFSMASVLGR